MMKPEFHLEGLKKAKWHEHVVRFVFGGIVTVIAGVVAHVWGPVIGGTLLAFPAILPAGLTLATKHDGRNAAIDEAWGATLASFGLAAFAAVIMSIRVGPFPIVIALAVVAWAIVSGGLWLVVCGRR